MPTQAPKQIEKLRAWWWYRQGLAPNSALSSPAAVFKQSGWARSVGGCGPYLTLFSRAGITREAADKAVADIEIHELPSARGCTYVVPAEDYSLALHLAQDFGSGDMRAAERLGVTQREVDTLCHAVVTSLKKGPLVPDDIRKAVGSAVRSLGAEGQKKGISSTLPLALSQLQRAGDIRRISTNGRLDNQRYQYGLWSPKPLARQKLDPAQAAVELAQRFFTWIGPARLSDFQMFAGISGKAAKIAVDGVKLETIAGTEGLLIPVSLRDEFESFKPPTDRYYRLITNLDSLLLLRRDLCVLINPSDMAHPLLVQASSKASGMLTELPSPAIIDRGRVAGLWEYDTASETIAYTVFAKPDSLLKAAVAQTEEYVRTQLGDARTFGLDSPQSRIPRIEALRKPKS